MTVTKYGNIAGIHDYSRILSKLHKAKLAVVMKSSLHQQICILGIAEQALDTHRSFGLQAVYACSFELHRTHYK